MRGLPGYGFSYSGVLLIGILQGLSVLADDTVTVYRPTGGSLDLSLNYTKESEIWAEWKFHGETFAEYTSLHQYSYKTSQFSGRLKEKQDQVGIIVQNLQSKDDGKFLIIAEVSQQQQPTKTIKLCIENPISDVQIEKNQTWMESTNSCVINIKCKALGSENAFYSWSGYKNESGAQVQITSSPVDGVVTMTCNATNNVSTKSASDTLTCNQTPTGAIPSFVWYAVIGCAAVLLVAVILVVTCYYRKCRKKPAVENEITVYADVNPGAAAQKNGRSASVNNGMGVYETVDDFRVAQEMTVYAKVAFPKREEPRATRPSTYQQVS